MKDLVLATIVSMALLMMSATVSMAIDTVPLPEKPTSTFSGIRTKSNSGQIMVGAWPIPEKPIVKYPTSRETYRIRMYRLRR